MRRAGFTLIELSIVLVIIGLIVGGVLVGQDLIETARVRKGVAYIDGYDSAVNTFRAKYNCIPGDCATADRFGLEDVTVDGTFGCNGNGDGRIGSGGAACDTTNRDEQLNFFTHLARANLIGVTESPWWTPDKYFPLSFPVGQNSYFLINALDGDDFYRYYAIDNMVDANCGSDECNSLSPMQAFRLDTKMDDGLPLTGRLRADGEFTDYHAGPTAGTLADGASCTLSTAPGGNKYNNLSLELSLCTLLIKLPF